MALPLAAALLLVAGQAAAPALTDEQKERFLRDGQIVAIRDAPGGVTGSRRATLKLDQATHDATIQTIDEAAPQKQLGSGFEVDFRDSWKNNVAAYRLDRLLGMRMIPVTVERSHDDKRASFTWWLDDLLLVERERVKKKRQPPDPLAWNRQMYAMRVFDQLIFNFDRNLGNLLIDGQWRLWLIDHSRAFKIFDQLRTPKALPETCDEGLLEGMRQLDKATLQERLGEVLSDSQIDGLLGRRDLIVKFYDELLASRGRASVLYRLPPR